MARVQRDKIQEIAPEVIAKGQKKYQMFLMMNQLHISKKNWDSLMNSKVYNRLRKNFTVEEG